MKRKKILILGAAGRDFHNFNVLYRDKIEYEVIGFTATQIPNIVGRKYPSVLAGKYYKKGIKIYPEEKLEKLIKKLHVDEVVFSYSDVSHEYVMHLASLVNAAGADFKLISPEKTMLKSTKPVISICAVRTGCGKSQTTRRLCEIIKSYGFKVVVVRHPMPYGNLEKQICQRFQHFGDFKKHKCTIEELEEYSHLVEKGIVVYAGVDYQKILSSVEKEADVIIWDGGNNDTPFFKPNLEIVVADPHRVGHELKYYPGEVNLRRADIVIINKVNTADKNNIQKLKENIKRVNKKAKIIEADSEIILKKNKIKGKKVLVIEDGPTLTHGEMSYGAGYVAAKKYGWKIVNAKKYAVGSIKETYKKYPHLKDVLPALGYGEKQIKELEKTVNRVDCDFIVSATPVNLSLIIKTKKPIIQVKYELKEKNRILEKIVEKFLRKYV